MDAVDFGQAMVQVEEIVDRESFQAWLEALPKARRYEVAVGLATRCALRVFPIWAAAMQQDWARKGDLTPLPSLRSMLISGVAVEMPTQDIRNAAVRAADAAYVAASAADAAVRAAADAADAAAASAAVRADAAAYAADAVVRAAASAAVRADAADAASTAVRAAAAASVAEIMSILRQDIQVIDRGDDLLTLPLWPGEIPDKIATAWTSGRTWMQETPGYSFWIRWYEAILEGRPLTGDWDSHWRLMQDIALIAPEDWDEGAKHVGGVIDEMEAWNGRSANDVSVDVSPLDGVHRGSPSASAKLIDGISREDVKATLARNKKVLPANLDAVSSLTELELERLERLRGDNSLSEELRDELKSLGERLQSLLDALDQMRERVEKFGDRPDDEDADAAKSLIKHFIELGQKWPRENSKELVDTAYRNVLGTVGNGFRLGGMFGAYSLLTLLLPVAPELAAGVAGTLFGAEKLAATIGKRLTK
ncbi:hypothetical protein [Tritonibacter scottomollicae]|uniref:hypothetical protein n=1 Tax=Tritonibacter scottomollicae TaxID=483013 RepID=UPI003BACC9BE